MYYKFCKYSNGRFLNIDLDPRTACPCLKLPIDVPGFHATGKAKIIFLSKNMYCC